MENSKITDRVKTFEDACTVLGKNHPYVKELVTVCMTFTFSSDLLAYLKLRIIAAALNEGWTPSFTRNELRYYPWFYLYTIKEWEGLDDKTKENGCLLGAAANDGATAGLAFVDSYYGVAVSITPVGSRLCFKTRELAEYCGKQFINIWADYLVGREM